MINPETYLKAAETVFLYQRAACNAIYEHSRYRAEPVFFEHFFKPEDIGILWFGHNFDEKEQNERATALLLMYEIAKDMETK